MQRRPTWRRQAAGARRAETGSTTRPTDAAPGRSTPGRSRVRGRQLVAAGSAVLTVGAALVALPTGSNQAFADPVAGGQSFAADGAVSAASVTAPLTPAQLQQALEQRALDQLGASRSKVRVPAAGTPLVTPPAPAAPPPAPAPAPAAAAAPSADSAASAASLDIARGLSAAHRWNDTQFSCLDQLWQRESRWRVTAVNTHSGAYGIPQALPGSRMAKAGADWRTNPATQIQWGLTYISERYGTPCAAWSHSRRYSWY